MRVDTILMSMLLLAACTADHESTAEAPMAVAFTATVGAGSTSHQDGTTRAANAIDDEATLGDKGGFGVFACYTGLHGYSDSNVKPDFMYNEHVIYAATPSLPSWTYSPIKYWPNGEGEATDNTGENKHYVTFMAYAPYSDNHNDETGYCIPSFSLQGEWGDPWLTYRLLDQENRTQTEYLSHQVDLLCAPTLFDQTKPAVNEKLLFQFDHALACVGDKITITPSEGVVNQVNGRVAGSFSDAKVVIKSFKIVYTLTAKARLVLRNSGEANWQTILSEEPTCTRTINVIDDETPIYSYTSPVPSPIPSQTIEGLGVFYIPKELSSYPQKADVVITYCIATKSGDEWVYDKENTGTATLYMNQYAQAYLPGKHLYINITLNQMDIALTAAIAPWEEEDPVDVEGIED